MATNHTTNYQLNQWEATAQVLRSDFNQDNQKIDAALKANADAQPLQRSPLTVQTPKAAAACYYNAAADFAAIYDTKFIAALHPAAQLRTTSAISAAVRRRQVPA